MTDRKPKIGLSTTGPKSTIPASENIVVLFEACGSERGKIGMAYMDVNHSEMFLCQFIDNNSYTLLKVRLAVIDPTEIVLPESNREGVRVLEGLLRSHCPGAQIAALPRRYFNDSRGIEMVKHYSVPECSNIDASVMEKYYAMAATSALIKYLEHGKSLMFAQNSLKVTYEALEDTCLIDVNSWVNIDMIGPMRGGVVKHFGGVSSGLGRKEDARSLYTVINNCVTKGGMRTLKANLLQPCANVKKLDARLDVVGELVASQAMLERIRNLLGGLGDLQQLVTMCAHVSRRGIFEIQEGRKQLRNKVMQAVEMRDLLVTANTLTAVLKNAKPMDFFQEGLQNVQKLGDERLKTIAGILEQTINIERVTRRKRKAEENHLLNDALLMAVREERHAVLDISRQVYQEVLSNVDQIAQKETTIFPKAELAYTASQRYHYVMPSDNPQLVSLPSHCLNVTRNRKSVSFTTRSLVKYSDRLVEAERDILKSSAEVIDQMVATLRSFLPAIYSCIEFTSHLDFYAAMACYSVFIPTVRPTFGSAMCVKAARHPILDVRQREVVPNDIDTDFNRRLTIIAGPNMAGKSTYLRTICLIQILAQMGCQVPADEACIIPMNRIFSRCGHNDSLLQGLSGFSIEMREMSTILHNANFRTLIVVDELARSTSTEEGMAMCYAICEKLLALNSFVFFATHFLDLSSMEYNYTAVQNYHFPASTEKDKQGVEVFKANHLIQRGAYNGPLYGLELARLTTLPETILENTQKMATKLRADRVDLQEVMASDEEVQEKALRLLARRIMSL